MTAPPLSLYYPGENYYRDLLESEDSSDLLSQPTEAVVLISKQDSREEVSPGSLLTLLDDKNRSIRSLKRQVYNQKLQLSFYLHRMLGGPRIVELSETCSPGEAEENIHINLALSQFCKQNGLKSKIMTLHQRMTAMERRILDVAGLQEDMVRAVTARAFDSARKGPSQLNVQACLSFFRERSPQVAALIKILNSSNKLRKQLDTFRACCDRLMAIEEERNALVEQVYSTPVTHRMNYGVLLAVQYEKMKLEKEVEEIKVEQRQLQERLLDLARAEPGPEGLSCVGDRSWNPNAPNNEIPLMTATVDRRDAELTGEGLRLKEVNGILAKEVVDLRASVEEKERALEGLRGIEGEMERVKTELQVLVGERDGLSERLGQYNNIEDEIRCLRGQLDDMGTLRSQRDYYKTQVEDLQAIRSAYAQLVERCPFPEACNDSTKRVEELEAQQAEHLETIEALTEKVTDRDTQIKCLLAIVDKLGGSADQSQGPAPDEGGSRGGSRTDPPEMADEKDKYKRDWAFYERLGLNFDEGNPRRTSKLFVARSVGCGGNSSIVSETSVRVQQVDWKMGKEAVEELFSLQPPPNPRPSIEPERRESTWRAPTDHKRSGGTFESRDPMVRQTATVEDGESKGAGRGMSTQTLDEYELMRDSSRETLPATVPSLHRIDCEGGHGEVPKDSQGEEISVWTGETVTGRLCRLTAELDRTLARPGGKGALLKTVRMMYGTVLDEK